MPKAINSALIPFVVELMGLLFISFCVRTPHNFIQMATHVTWNLQTRMFRFSNPNVRPRYFMNCDKLTTDFTIITDNSYTNIIIILLITFRSLKGNWKESQGPRFTKLQDESENLCEIMKIVFYETTRDLNTVVRGPKVI